MCVCALLCSWDISSYVRFCAQNHQAVASCGFNNAKIPNLISHHMWPRQTWNAISSAVFTFIRKEDLCQALWDVEHNLDSLCLRRSVALPHSANVTLKSCSQRALVDVLKSTALEQALKARLRQQGGLQKPAGSPADDAAPAPPLTNGHSKKHKQQKQPSGSLL